MWSVQKIFNQDSWSNEFSNPCGGGVEYLHRDPASRRRWRKGKSQIRDSKMDPRKTAPGKGQQYLRKTRPLVRDGAPQK
jgi:hypothetical protein